MDGASVDIVINGNIVTDINSCLRLPEGQFAFVNDFLSSPILLNYSDRINFCTRVNTPEAVSSIVSLLIQIDL